MKIIDNSPVGAPAIGRIVVESYEVEQLADCHLYLLPSNTEVFADKAREVFGMLMEKMGAGQLVNDYKLELLSENLKLENHPELMLAIKEERSNIIMPLSTPSKFDKQYLIVHTDEKDLFTHIPLMIYTSERVSKFSIAEQMKMLAQEQPEDMLAFIKDRFDDDAFLKRYLTGAASNRMHPTFGMAVSKSMLKSQIGIKGKITHQDKLKMMEDVEENFTKARRNEKLDAQITWLIQSADAEDIKKFIYSLNKNQQKKFFQMMNTKRTGEEAGAWLEVRYEGKIKSDSRTKGRYRLYVTNGKKAELVEFANSDSFLIHLLYIIEKAISNDVNTLDFNKYKDLFVKLSWEVYRFCDGEERYKKITRGRDDEGNSKERRLSDCLGDIKNSVSKSCKKLGVLPSPYYIENADEHLYVSKNDIVLPDELLEVIKKWKNTL